jgi:hypothetical protein
MASALNTMISTATVPEIINITTALSTRLGQIAGASVARAPVVVAAAARAPVVVATGPAAAAPLRAAAPAAARAPVVIPAAKPAAAARASATSTINPFGPLPAAASTINPFAPLPAASTSTINPFGPSPASASAGVNLQAVRGASAILTDTNRRRIVADAAKARIQASAANVTRAAAAAAAQGRATIERLGTTIPKPSAVLESARATATKRAKAVPGRGVGNGQLGGAHQKYRKTHKRSKRAQ